MVGRAVRNCVVISHTKLLDLPLHILPVTLFLPLNIAKASGGIGTDVSALAASRTLPHRSIAAPMLFKQAPEGLRINRAM